MDWLTIGAGALRIITLLAGLLLMGGVGAGLLLRRMGVAPQAVVRAQVRLAVPLVAGLLVAAPVLAVVETLWETNAQRDPGLLPELVPYMLLHTLFGVLWAGQVSILAVIALRLRRGQPPGLLAGTLLLMVWPQISHLAPPYQFMDGGVTLAALGWLGVHRLGAALWLGSLAALLFWQRTGGPVPPHWGAAFFRLAVPGAAILAGGAVGSVLTHGGMAVVVSPTLFTRFVQIKIGLLLAAGTLGARHFWRYRRVTEGPRPTLTLELTAAIGAAALGAVLGLMPSPE